MGRESNFKRSVGGLGLLMVSSLVVGCGTEPPSYTMPDAATLASDARYMAARYAERPSRKIGMRVDLSDERQYQFVVNRLLAAGKTPENAPHLFDELASSRARRIAGATTDGVGSAQMALTVDPCGHALPHEEVPVNGGSRFTGKVIGNCSGGTPYMFADLNSYYTAPDGSGHTTLGYFSGEQYDDGIDFEDVTFAAVVPFGKKAYQDSMLYASVGDDSYVNFAVDEEDIVSVPATLDLSHPTEVYDSPQYTTDNDDPSTPEYDPRIRVCLMRGGTDCDYAVTNQSGVAYSTPLAGMGSTKVPPSNPWVAAKNWLAEGGFNANNAYIPLSGFFDAGSKNGTPCTVKGFNQGSTVPVGQSGGKNGVLSATAQIFLIDPNVGGPSWKGGLTCPEGPNAPNAAGFVDKLRARVANPQPGDVANLIPFDFLGDFGTDCYGYEYRVKLVINIKVMTDNCGIKTIEPMEVKPIDFKNSCFAAGTQVLRADGTYVAIEQIRQGERVIIDASGTTMTVMDVSRGLEREPMIRVLDDQGHNVLVTPQHPMLTASRGLTVASALRVGDRIRTESGIGTVVHVEREPYDGQVFNLALGTADELQTIGREHRTMFANGFLVGDNNMQWELATQQTNMSRDPLAALPSVWHGDYENSLARSAPRLLE